MVGHDYTELWITFCNPGTMATADCTTSTYDEGECWEEVLHSLSCSEDKDRGELVCTGLIFI